MGAAGRRTAARRTAARVLEGVRLSAPADEEIPPCDFTGTR